MYLTILDFNNGRVGQIKVPDNLTSNGYEKIMDNAGFKVNNCEYMVHRDNKIYNTVKK
jgi:hypothetical protein